MRKGFSLLELLIVVVIVGLVYTLAVVNLQRDTEIQVPLTLSNLREFLQTVPHQKSVELLCINECKSCYVLSDKEHLNEYDTLLDNLVDRDTEIYSYTMYNRFEQKEKQIYFTSEREYKDVCFSYKINAQGHGEDIFVVSKNYVYDLASSFTNNRYDSLSEAEAARHKFETRVFQ